jgi:peptide chain release factor 1
MKASLLSKLDHLCERHQEVSRMLSDAEVIADQTQFRSLSQEYAELEPVVRTYEQYLVVEQAMAEARLLLEDADPDMRQLAHQELNAAQTAREQLELE